MVTQVGLNQSLNYGLKGNVNSTPTNLNANVGQNSSLFSNYGSLGTSDYTQDVMMSGLNFGQLASNLQTPTQNPEIQNPQVAQLPESQASFTSNPQYQKQTPTQQIESVKKFSNIGKILGVTGGVVGPIVPKIISLFKGQKFAEVFKFKPLAISCAIFGVVGLGMGMLIDSCINSKKANKNNS